MRKVTIFVLDTFELQYGIHWLVKQILAFQIDQDESHMFRPRFQLNRLTKYITRIFVLVVLKICASFCNFWYEMVQKGAEEYCHFPYWKIVHIYKYCQCHAQNTQKTSKRTYCTHNHCLNTLTVDCQQYWWGIGLSISLQVNSSRMPSKRDSRSDQSYDGLYEFNPQSNHQILFIRKHKLSSSSTLSRIDSFPKFLIICLILC